MSTTNRTAVFDHITLRSRGSCPRHDIMAINMQAAGCTPVSCLLRELRVILHPPLLSHGCIMQALAHGWYHDPIIGMQPYLVLEYSDYGSLTDYLRRSKISPVERRELALDTASALNALHSCRIIHGDIKPENVLIYDNDDNESYLDNLEVRSQIARLADFGAAVFEQDFILQREVSYLGTPKYLSPEFAGRPGVSGASESPTFDSHKSADVYSLGLVIWEIIKDGHKYIDDHQLSPGQNWEDYLDHLCSSKSDALLSVALSFCNSLPELEQHPVIHDALTKTLAMCLKDEPSRRGRMEEIIPVLVDGTRITRPRYTTSRSRFLPLPEPSNDSDRSVTTLVPARKSEDGLVKRIQFNVDGNLKVRVVDEDESMPDGITTDVGGLLLMKPSKTSALENRGLDIISWLWRLVNRHGRPSANWQIGCGPLSCTVLTTVKRLMPIYNLLLCSI
ncbi:hypothetical protein FJTKL_11429 [Diaporthe vaccinii]|uniref:Protein kinase domain-containing protein n=1 Tax=Diaporthe vaccinii TaxID=105482 RepID=A0ABR4EH48_9PEZI